jgi:hypothetical protein
MRLPFPSPFVPARCRRRGRRRAAFGEPARMGPDRSLHLAGRAGTEAADLDWLEGGLRGVRRRPTRASWTRFRRRGLAGLRASAYEEIDTVAGRVMSLRGAALLPADHRCRTGEVPVRPARKRSPTFHHAAWCSSPSRLNRLADATGYDALIAANARSRPLQARVRPDAGDEALPVVRRAGEIPARPPRRWAASAWNKLFDETIAGLRSTWTARCLRHRGSTLNLLTEQDGARTRGGRPRANSAGCSKATTCRCSPASTTRWSRRRRSTTAGARCLPAGLAPPGQPGGTRGGRRAAPTP